jgi:hypothetical protein
VGRAPVCSQPIFALGFFLSACSPEAGVPDDPARRGVVEAAVFVCIALVLAESVSTALTTRPDADWHGRRRVGIVAHSAGQQPREATYMGYVFWIKRFVVRGRRRVSRS